MSVETIPSNLYRPRERQVPPRTEDLSEYALIPSNNLQDYELISPAENHQTTEKVKSKERTGIWAQPITVEEAQYNSRKMLVLRGLYPVVDTMIDAFLKGGKWGYPTTASENEDTRSQVESGLIDVIYSGEVAGLPEELRTEGFDISHHYRHHDGDTLDKYARLVHDHAPRINAVWDSQMKMPDLPWYKRSRIAAGTTYDMLPLLKGVGRKKNSSQVYRALSYSEAEIIRMQEVLKNSTKAYTAIAIGNDFASNLFAKLTPRLGSVHDMPAPDELKYGMVAVAAATFYGLQIRNTIPRVRRMMEEDPDVTPNPFAYMAHPVAQKMLAENERGKDMVVGTAFMIHPYELYKEVVWNAIRFTDSDPMTVSIAGDASGAALQAAQAMGLYPRMSAYWKQGEKFLNKMKGISE